MRQYVGPAGYGANPEFGGDAATGKNRMRSMSKIAERLTPTHKERILKEFEPFKADIRKIDKYNGFVRIWYNNDERLYK